MRARIATAVTLLAVAACSRPTPVPTPPGSPTPIQPATPSVTPGQPDPKQPDPKPKPKDETPAEDPNQPKPYARFTFENDEDANLGTGKVLLLRRNAPVKDGAAVLNGVYPLGPDEDKASVLTVRTPQLVYDGFTVGIRFRADEFPPDRFRNNAILVAGRAYRWFALSRTEAGTLVVELNQGRPAFEVKTPPIDAGKWTTVACSVDRPRRKIVVFVNGKKVLEDKLPADFSWAVEESEEREADKVWMFVNFSTGKTFKGAVGGFVFYDTPLTAEQMAKIPLKP